MSATKKIFPAMCRIAFGEPGAKQPQDKKPCPEMARSPARAGSVDYSLWSHPSLHSRCGTRISATRPSLARVNLPPSIPARPFGLGWRFDRTPLVAPASLRRISCQPLTDPRNRPSLARFGTQRKRAARIATGTDETAKQGSARRARAGQDARKTTASGVNQ